MNNFRYLENVVTLCVDQERCVACAMCTQVCPHGVLGLDGRKIYILDRDGCMECGACARNCPTGAISVTPGVGCAGYIIQSWLKGKENAACGGPGCC
jgi:NAD-dependent dihydropyrimidine dehydrogenase PreA subunit